jgi:hypothetical protein
MLHFPFFKNMFMKLFTIPHSPDRPLNRMYLVAVFTCVRGQAVQSLSFVPS